jgi:hypothetical protein
VSENAQPHDEAVPARRAGIGLEGRQGFHNLGWTRSGGIRTVPDRRPRVGHEIAGHATRQTRVNSPSRRTPAVRLIVPSGRRHGSFVSEWRSRRTVRRIAAASLAGPDERPTRSSSRPRCRACRRSSPRWRSTS